MSDGFVAKLRAGLALEHEAALAEHDTTAAPATTDAATVAQLRQLHDLLLTHLRQIRAAYYDGMSGVEYADLAKAARRVLEVRVQIEQASGRRVTTRVSREAIATLLRSSLR